MAHPRSVASSAYQTGAMADTGPSNWAAGNARPRWKLVQLTAMVALVVAGVLSPGLDRKGLAAGQVPARWEPAEGTSSDAARQDALRSLPLERLSPAGRAKAEAVLSNLSIFRRMPAKTIDCDPDLYLFLVRHPDVVVNIWELLKISQVQLRQAGPNHFQLTEPGGTAIALEFLYRSRDTQVIYGEGTYQGPVLARPLVGHGLAILKTRYARQPNGRWHITSRMDSFLAIEPITAELLTKTISPLLGKTADHNFTQTAAFVGSLSRTAEVNIRSVRRMASQLSHVQPEVRDGFSDLAAAIARNAPPPMPIPTKSATPVAGRSEDKIDR